MLHNRQFLQILSISLIEGQILFDINTGEVVASFVGEKRVFFYDEDAMILFDEESGEILFSPPLD